MKTMEFLTHQVMPSLPALKYQLPNSSPSMSPAPHSSTSPFGAGTPFEKMAKNVDFSLECSDPRDVINHYLRVKVLTTMTRLLNHIEQEHIERTNIQKKTSASSSKSAQKNWPALGPTSAQQNKEFSIVEYSYDAKEEAELQNILTTVIESLYDYDDFVLTEVTRLLALLEQWYKARDQIQTSFVYHFDEKTTTKNVVNNNNQSCIETELTHNHHQHHRKIRWADEEGYELTLVKEFGHFH